MDRSNRVIAFIETLRTPDGSSVGKPLVLRDWQKDMIRSVYGPRDEQGRRTVRQAVFSAGRKNGKGLALDTPIPTPHGWTTMKDIRVGDTLYDEQGKFCSVTFVSEDRFIDCYEMKFSNGEKIVCDGDHLWSTYARVDSPGVTHSNKQNPDGNGKKNGHKRVRDTREIFHGQTFGARGDRNYSLDMPAPIYCEESDLPV